MKTIILALIVSACSFDGSGVTRIDDSGTQTIDSGEPDSFQPVDAQTIDSAVPDAVTIDAELPDATVDAMSADAFYWPEFTGDFTGFNAEFCEDEFGNMWGGGGGIISSHPDSQFMVCWFMKAGGSDLRPNDCHMFYDVATGLTADWHQVCLSLPPEAGPLEGRRGCSSGGRCSSPSYP